MIGVAFFLGSLFAEQIRTSQKSYPFLEIVGKAGAGKSTLVEFLWKLIGRDDYEGFDPNKSTTAARSRIMTQGANIPISLIESERENTAKSASFDWEELKTAYNGRASRARGVKNGGNDTYEPPFRGSVLISQNDPVNASEAIMSRLVHLFFDTKGHNYESKLAADELASMPVEQVSHFLVMACLGEKEFLQLYQTNFARYEAQLSKDPDIKLFRIAKTHAQMKALVDVLARLVNLPTSHVKEIQDCLTDAAKSRQQAIGADHPIVEEFWDAYDFINDKAGENLLNHANDDRHIAINLNEFQSSAAKWQLYVPARADLIKHLKTSRKFKFVEIKTVNSSLRNLAGSRSVKCWLFDKGAPKNARL